MMLAWLLGASASSAAAPAPEPADLLQALREPPPSRSAFFERRSSPLLATPLLLQGELSRPQPGTLVKRVDAPFRELTTIRDQRVVVERDASAPRRFSLRRAPELAALTASVEAVLGGDLALLERHYALRMDGDAAAWVLHLEPRDARLRKRVEAMRLLGAGHALHCMDLALVGAETSRSWLGARAARAAAATDEGARDALCGDAS